MMKEIVEIIDGKPMTTSLKVADIFETDHKSILQTIGTIHITLHSIEEEPLNFKSKKSFNGNELLDEYYFMDQTAFTALSFCLTGKKAMQHRITFMQKFNQLELELLKEKQELIDLNDLSEALRVIANKLITVESLPVTVTETPEAEENPAAAFFRQLSVTSVYKHRETGKTDAVRWLLPKMGLRPTLTTNWLVEKEYLKTVSYAPGNQKERALKVPTEKGEFYFQILPNVSLVVTPAGKSLLANLKSTGQIPEHCLLATE